MEIILVNITKGIHSAQYYKGGEDTIKADEARSGCRVWCISDIPIDCENYIPYSSCSYTGREMLKANPYMLNRWEMLCLLRQFAVYDFVKSRDDLTWPIFPLDNDIMVFSDLNKVYKPFLSYDFTVPIYDNIRTTGAYSIHNIECLEAGINTIKELFGKEPELLKQKLLWGGLLLNDMTVWSMMFQSGKWKVANLLSEEIDGVPIDGIFDTNIHMGEDKFVMEPSSVPMWGNLTKKITWIDGNPYFTKLIDNSLVRANWIHCWGSYKFRTHELIEKAGLL
jgi:hypothetical protein